MPTHLSSHHVSQNFLLRFFRLRCVRSAVRVASPRSKRTSPALAIFKPLPAPAPSGLLLKKGDRLAICGDSITQQKMYSRIIETYLTVCTPELDITARQYGWSGRTRGRIFWADGERLPPIFAHDCDDVLWDERLRI